MPRCGECMNDFTYMKGEKWPHEQGEMAIGKYSLQVEYLGINFCVVYFSFQKTCSDSEAIFCACWFSWAILLKT